MLEALLLLTTTIAVALTVPGLQWLLICVGVYFFVFVIISLFNL